MKKEIIETLFGYSEATYYRWKKEERPIIKLIENYFDDEEIEEFVKTGKISKYDGYNKLTEHKQIIQILEEIEIETGNETINKQIFLADFALYLYRSIYTRDYKKKLLTDNYNYTYILSDTYIYKEIKIYTLTKNNIKLEYAVKLLTSVANDCKDILDPMPMMKKDAIIKLLNNFVLIIIYLKYNNLTPKMPSIYMTFSNIKSDFFQYLCQHYKKEINEDTYPFERFKKQEIIEGANNYIKQLKNNQNK